MVIKPFQYMLRMTTVLATLTPRKPPIYVFLINSINLGLIKPDWSCDNLRFNIQRCSILNLVPVGHVLGWSAKGCLVKYVNSALIPIGNVQMEHFGRGLRQ